MKVMITMPKTASVAVDFEYGDAWEMFRDLSARLIGEPHGEVAKEPKESSAEVKPRNLLEEKVEIKSQEVQAIAAIPIFGDNPALEPEERLLLGSAQGIGDCKMGGNCNEDTDCDDQDVPEWDCDLGQSNRYCIHHQD